MQRMITGRLLCAAGAMILSGLAEGQTVELVEEFNPSDLQVVNGELYLIADSGEGFGLELYNVRRTARQGPVAPLLTLVSAAACPP